MNSQNISVSY